MWKLEYNPADCVKKNQEEQRDVQSVKEGSNQILGVKTNFKCQKISVVSNWRLDNYV